MKNYLVSTFAAIALAVPLGIGGLTLSAPVTATDADAQSAIQHWFDTCSSLTIARCHPSHQTYILQNGHKFGYQAGRGYLPYASDGADYKAYDYLKNRLDNGPFNTNRDETGRLQRDHWQAAFDRFFPDGQRPPVPSLTEEELDEAVARLNFQQPGNTTQDRLEAFNRRCDREGGTQTQRFQFGSSDWAANQCRVEATVPNADPNAEPTIETRIASFNPNPHPDDDPLGRFVQSTPNFLFQVTAIDPFSSTNMNPFDDEEGEAVRQHREAIIELQGEVTTHDEAIASMLQVQSTHRESIRSNTSSISALSTRVETFADDIQKNTAGIALAYAFPSAGLNYNESFRLSGGAGYFEEEAAVAFGFTGRLSPTVTASGGVGLADGVTGGRVEIGFGW